ncbi:MAG: plasmid stabilization protein [Alphaproteobacteria bacterium HGW-Alphaproteobacteria-16]|nr:MAG: plasmid stabilization protein [Alphaproteobacteria bacterium HGW-Alphaproteobacteria-16]
MKRYRVEVGRQARDQLAAIEAYIVEHATLEIATRYVEAILEKIAGLDAYPFRGTPRDDLRPGVRTIVFRRSVLIAYRVDEEVVTILNILTRGRDVETWLRE